VIQFCARIASALDCGGASRRFLTDLSQKQPEFRRDSTWNLSATTQRTFGIRDEVFKVRSLARSASAVRSDPLVALDAAKNCVIAAVLNRECFID
jgi:hypothetical protein